MIEFKPGFSRRILFRLVFLAAIAAAIITAGLGYIENLYLREQVTPFGLLINGAIVILFLLGLGRVIGTLIRYMREEAALGKFIKRLDDDHARVADNIDQNSLIIRRYRALLLLGKQHAPINHGTLASTLLASESTRLSFPKFINNILILMGVFGTIVSLSIALVGASSLLETAGQLGNMGLVIHGMSTALSTTITAIVCYVFYGYFYLKLTDAQTHLLSGIEQVTSLYLLPKYAHSSDTMLHEVGGLVRSLNRVAQNMEAAQRDYADSGRRLRELVANLGPHMHRLTEDVQRIKQLMREGFRLSPEDDDEP
jgi:hypothetical protein